MHSSLFRFVSSLAMAATLSVATLTAGAAQISPINPSHLHGVYNPLSIQNTALSADGRFVVYTSPRLGEEWYDPGMHVYLHDRLNHSTVEVSSPSTWMNQDATISANGRFIAFVTNAGGLSNLYQNLFVYDRATAEQSCITCDMQASGFNSPSLSADGRMVAFAAFAALGGFTMPNVYIHDRHSHQTRLVSVDATGNPGDAGSYEPSISADGRVVAFSSWASNLVPTVTPEGYRVHVFVRDLMAHQTTRVSEGAQGLPGDGDSASPALSADGRHVAFASMASNLVSGDTNQMADIFVRDRLTGRTERISRDSLGVEANGDSPLSTRISDVYNQFIFNSICGCVTLANFDINSPEVGVGAPSISADGRFVAFDSEASNLVVGDGNGRQDVFVHDRVRGTTRRVSVDGEEKETTGGSGFSSMSADGKTVVFLSKGDLMGSNPPPDGSGLIYNQYDEDIFAKELFTTTKRHADLALEVVGTPREMGDGVITADLVITNQGPNDAKRLTLTDVVSAGEILNLNPSRGECAGAAVGLCRLGRLAAGERVTVTATVRRHEKGSRQRLSVKSDSMDYEYRNNHLLLGVPSATATP